MEDQNLQGEQEASLEPGTEPVGWAEDFGGFGGDPEFEAPGAADRSL